MPRPFMLLPGERIVVAFRQAGLEGMHRDYTSLDAAVAEMRRLEETRNDAAQRALGRVRDKRRASLATAK